MKMTKLKHVNKMLQYLIEKTHTYEWEEKLSSKGERTLIDFVCGKFSHSMLLLEEASLDYVLAAVATMYLAGNDSGPKELKCDACNKRADMPYRDKINGKEYVLCDICHFNLEQIGQFLAFRCHIDMWIDSAIEPG